MRIATVILVWILAGASFATDQVPSTFVVKSKGTWTLWSDYVGGGAVIIDDEDANKKKVIGVSDLLPTVEYEMFLTTAGPQWGEYALYYLLDLDGRRVFRARTRYKTDILIDLDAGKVLNPNDWRTDLVASDKKLIASVLKDGATTMASPQLTISRAERVHAAIVHAMHYSMVDMLPWMRKLEGDDYCNSGVYLPRGWGRFTSQPPIGEETYWHYAYYETRRLTNLAIRRFGASPRGFPVINFVGKGALAAIAPSIRCAAVPELRSGFSPREVHGLIGPPDYVHRESWRYDIDDTTPFSFIVYWDIDGTVKTTERVTPPLWDGDVNQSIDGRVTPNKDRPAFAETDDSASPLWVKPWFWGGVVIILVLASAGIFFLTVQGKTPADQKDSQT